MLKPQSVQAIVDQLCAIFDESVANLREALGAYIERGERPDPDKRAAGCFAYPELRIEYHPSMPRPAQTPTRAFARLNDPGCYASSIARPRLFRDYIAVQLQHLIDDYGVDVSVGRSNSEIPYPYVIDDSGIEVGSVSTTELSRWFPSNELVHIGDEVADGIRPFLPYDCRPLALFDGPRTDFSLARLQHYTGTPAEHFQHFVLFTNYVRYVDEFVDFAIGALRRKDGAFKRAVGAGRAIRAGRARKCRGRDRGRALAAPPDAGLSPDGRRRQGITLVNIGVGPSNAKTICDHIAVLRPEVWLMIGHCGGLRPSQTIGDYVLAHAYLRDDHLLDDVLPVEIPIPAIAEVQKALFDAAMIVTGEEEDDLKRRLRTGTVVTTDDRNWELRYTASSRRFNQSRAVAIDMESATVAAQGYRFRVPYGTLLCVSDKPLHGELKLPGQANAFYERAISQHLRIGIEAIALLKLEGDALHSRKLRSFDEPPLR